jgi:hypothetical protein
MNFLTAPSFIRHSRESGNPFLAPAPADEWIPAFAGMTIKNFLRGAFRGAVLP